VAASHWFLSPAVPTPLTSGLGIGSSLFFRRDWWQDHRFHATSLGEDAMFASVAHTLVQLHLVDDCTQMYAVRHAGNTWQFTLPQPGWTKINSTAANYLRGEKP
jgi:hypothetical protein